MVKAKSKDIFKREYIFNRNREIIKNPSYRDINNLLNEGRSKYQGDGAEQGETIKGLVDKDGNIFVTNDLIYHANMTEMLHLESKYEFYFGVVRNDDNIKVRQLRISNWSWNGRVPKKLRERLTYIFGTAKENIC